MENQEARFLNYFQSHEVEILADLTKLVRSNSTTNNKELSEQCAIVLEGIV